jgi:hypothetical protein
LSSFGLTGALASVIKTIETVIASEAKQSSLPRKEGSWIASSQALLAMTA